MYHYKRLKTRYMMGSAIGNLPQQEGGVGGGGQRSSGVEMCISLLNKPSKSDQTRDRNCTDWPRDKYFYLENINANKLFPIGPNLHKQIKLLREEMLVKNEA